MRPRPPVLLENEPGASADEQLDLGEKLYYKTLLSFLEAEERRPKVSDFSTLLANEAFHTSLLACCLESVFASYSTSSMAFPAILHHLSLQPFDFGKVIELFIKHEPALPSHLKQHFADVESRIIEELAEDTGFCHPCPSTTPRSPPPPPRSATAAAAARPVARQGRASSSLSEVPLPGGEADPGHSPPAAAAAVDSGAAGVEVAKLVIDSERLYSRVATSTR